MSEHRKNIAPWNKGKIGVFKHSKKSKLQMSISRKGSIPWHAGTHGLKKHSKETIEKIRKSNTGHSVSSATRLKIGHANSLHRHTEKTKKILSEKARLRNILRPNKKFSNTIIEQKTAAELERRGLIRGVDFFQNFGLANIKNVDFYLPKLNAVIECDGCVYHSCSIHYPTLYVEAKERDKKLTQKLQNAGFDVYRFWEHDINTSIEKCINKIKFLQENLLEKFLKDGKENNYYEQEE